MRKDWFAVFKVKITVKIDPIKMTVSNVSTDFLILLQPTLNRWNIIISWSVLCKDMIVVVKFSGHIEGLKLNWIFVNPIFSVPLTFLQLN